MDPRTGEISWIPAEEFQREYQKLHDRAERMVNLENRTIEIHDDEANVLKTQLAKVRKNWMRNKPCVCGSGKKFKKCCWSAYQ